MTCPDEEIQQKNWKIIFDLPLPQRFASAPATILRVCGSSVLDAVFASS